jgi:hypothetical protein
VTARFRRHADLRLTELGGEGIVLHLGSRRYFSVSGSGLTMLRALVEPRSLDELVQALTAEYEVDAARARASATQFLDQCRSAGLVVEEAE